MCVVCRYLALHAYNVQNNNKNDPSTLKKIKKNEKKRTSLTIAENQQAVLVWVAFANEKLFLDKKIEG